MAQPVAHRGKSSRREVCGERSEPCHMVKFTLTLCCMCDKMFVKSNVRENNKEVLL